MDFKINTPYNYQRRKVLVGNYCAPVVEQLDTSITEAVNNSNSSNRDDSQRNKGVYYSHTDDPINIYGPGITMTEFDPIMNKRRARAAAQAQQSQQISAAASHASQASSAASASNSSNVQTE